MLKIFLRTIGVFILSASSVFALSLVEFKMNQIKTKFPLAIFNKFNYPIEHNPALHRYKSSYWSFRTTGYLRDSVEMIVFINDSLGILKFSELHKRNGKNIKTFIYSVNKTNKIDFIYADSLHRDSLIIFDEFDPTHGKSDSMLLKKYYPKLEESVNELRSMIIN